MNKIIIFCMSAFLLNSCSPGSNVRLKYPVTRQDSVVDTIFGTPVPDPYRWLEDDMSEDSRMGEGTKHPDI
jgi:prolyl oligopeptidase